MFLVSFFLCFDRAIKENKDSTSEKKVLNWTKKMVEKHNLGKCIFGTLNGALGFSTKNKQRNNDQVKIGDWTITYDALIIFLFDFGNGLILQRNLELYLKST